MIDLFIDDSPTALDRMIIQENEMFLTSMIPCLMEILQELSELDRKIILLYFEHEEIPSFREMGRQLNIDYRKVQRHIPKIMDYIEKRLTESLKKEKDY